MIQQLVAALYIFAVVSHTPVLAEQAFNYAKKFTGQATFYDANSGQGGACSLNNPLPKGTTTMVAAMNAPQYGGSSVCGACVHVSGSKGAVMVRIVDLCPECPSGNLDLSKEAFAVIDDPCLWQNELTFASQRSRPNRMARGKMSDDGKSRSEV